MDVQKKTRIKKACINCQRAHLSCENDRPCKRCIERETECIDRESKKRGRKKKEETLAAQQQVVAPIIPPNMMETTMFKDVRKLVPSKASPALQRNIFSEELYRAVLEDLETPNPALSPEPREKKPKITPALPPHHSYSPHTSYVPHPPQLPAPSPMQIERQVSVEEEEAAKRWAVINEEYVDAFRNIFIKNRPKSK
eukprot:TRINITY_DN10312_c0_g1_i1.p1 TRINITY_DN10312_c0_g1~~TRINITY_DN10312_c0_g1_i1.p1  ORF type:complete len:197 (-),score=41.25 TRINITY_DN10312_c0_g1_i1:186-776(-)